MENRPPINLMNKKPAPLDYQLKVLMVTPRYFPLSGGVENHVYQVARRFPAMGLDVTVLTTDPGRGLPAEEIHEGVKIQRVPAWPKNRDYYFAPQIYTKIAGGGWDIIHLESYHTLVAPLAMSAAWKAKIPYVVTFHGGGHSSNLRNALRSLQRISMRPLFAHAGRLVATACFEIDQYSRELRLPKDRFVYIPNGADIGEVLPKQPNTNSHKLILSVGRLERYKGHQRLLSAMPEILNKCPDVRLWILGEGPFRDELQALSEKLGVSNQVEIRSVPVKDRQAMMNVLAQADLMVLLSEFETHPMSVLEAALTGLPVIVADTSGLTELAEQGIAQAIPLKSTPQQVAEAVCKQLSNPLKPAQFDLPTWDQCATDLLSLYKELHENQGDF